MLELASALVNQDMPHAAAPSLSSHKHSSERDMVVELDLSPVESLGKMALQPHGASAALPAFGKAAL